MSWTLDLILQPNISRAIALYREFYIVNRMEKYLDGRWVDIRKVTEDQSSADYIFYCTVWVTNGIRRGRLSPHQTNFGRVRIDKVSGEVKLIDPMPDDIGNRRASATAFKLRQDWKQGTFPQITLYASG